MGAVNRGQTWCLKRGENTFFRRLKGGGGIRTCEITGGEREPLRALTCPHSLFPFSFPPGFSSESLLSFLGRL